MTDTLSAILAASARPVAIFTDFDGTLVEIAPTPDTVIVPPDLPLRLQTLSAALDGAFAVITGRTIAAIDGFLPGQSFSVGGSHGAERRHQGQLDGPDPAYVKAAKAVARHLEEAIGHEAGILIEPKPTGVAVHYRAAPKKEDLARSALKSALGDIAELHAIEGKKVIEARPRSADKGQAVADLMQVKPFAGRMPIFIGDDVTDEDGFAAARDLGGFGVKIGEGETCARFRLPDIGAVYRYFDALAAGETGSVPLGLTRADSRENMVK